MPVLVGLFVVSISLFAYQVTLTRIYSAALAYHYVFLTTSFAIMGLGIGSVLAYFNRTRINILGRTDSIDFTTLKKQLGIWSFILTCAFLFVFLLIYVQLYGLFAYAIIGIFPFVVSGYIYALLFKAMPHISGKLYFSDLLGAGFASVAIILLLNNMGMFRTIVLICLLPLSVSLVLSNKKLRIASSVMAAFFAFGLFLAPARLIETNFRPLLDNTEKTYGHLQRTGLSPEIVFSRWDSFARTDLIRLEAIPEVKFLTIDGAANAPMYAFDGNMENLDVFRMNMGYIPFVIGENESSLIIGAGGGRGILFALAAGSTDVTAVEINPAAIEAVRLFGNFNGDIFDRPDVRVYSGDGRNFVRTTNENFDVIFLSLVVTSTTQGLGFALTENYIHTVEAMEDYLERLNYNGRVVFVTHDEITLARLTTTAIQALVNRGIPLQRAPSHIATYFQLVESQGNHQVVAPVIIIKNEPFSETESNLLVSEIERIGASPMFVPHIHEQGIVSHLQEGQISFEQFVDSFVYRAAPVTDNSPYFFNFERGIPTVLVQILIFSLIGSLLLFILCVRLDKAAGGNTTPKRLARSALAEGLYSLRREVVTPPIYFGLLGMGFMMIQIPLIQRFILYLGHPTPAFSYTLAAMLIGCGIGGFVSGHKFFEKKDGKIYLPPVFAGITVIIIMLLFNPILDATIGFDLLGRVAVAAAIAVAIGFFVGMPFPAGLAHLGSNGKKNLIPLMWGINGTMSVAGSVLSVIVSMSFGFTAAIIIGAATYFIVGLLR